MDGLSAYEIYIKYYPGYIGTEFDWIRDLASGQLVKTVTLNFDGGTTSSYKTSYFYGEKLLTLPITSRQDYSFDSWQVNDQSIGDTYYVVENLTIKAIWKPVVDNNISYTITWQNYDGTVLEIDSNVSYGENPSYNGENPIRINTSEFSYIFIGWSPTITVVIESATYTAQYNQSLQVSPEALYFDYLCNNTTTWEQCDETSGTVKNLTVFGREITYYRRFALIQYIFTSGTKYTVDLKNSTLRYEYAQSYYQRDLLFKTWAGNLTRKDADTIEKNFLTLLTNIENHFVAMDSIYNRKLKPNDFNPNWEVLENYETNLYVSPEEQEAIELAEIIKNIVIDNISYYQSSSTYIDGSFRITNNTGKTIDYMSMSILYYNSNNQIINSEFANTGTLFNNASVIKSLINRIEGYSYTDIAYIKIVITKVDVT